MSIDGEGQEEAQEETEEVRLRCAVMTRLGMVRWGKVGVNPNGGREEAMKTMTVKELVAELAKYPSDQDAKVVMFVLHRGGREAIPIHQLELGALYVGSPEQREKVFRTDDGYGVHPFADGEIGVNTFG